MIILLRPHLGAAHNKQTIAITILSFVRSILISESPNNADEDPKRKSRKKRGLLLSEFSQKIDPAFQQARSDSVFNSR
jgi:hypothetical protein